MTATREDVLVRPIRPEEYHALGELTVAAYHSLPVMPQQEFYDAQFRNVERRARLSCVPAARHLYESMGFRREPTLDFAPVPGVDLIAYVFDLAAGI